MTFFTPAQIDSSRWTSRRVHLSGKPSTPSEVSLHYISCPPQGDKKGTILLIHGYPETSYQFRHVITPLANAGYEVIAPDYRGAGLSSHPRDGYEKVRMATDLHELLIKHIGIKEKVHVVGHDIGGMIVHAYAARFSDDTASVAWGECPLPGTSAYERFVREETLGGVWHFVFHWQTDLPEALTAGRERIYIKHFCDRLGINAAAFSPEDVDHYASMFAQPGGMRSGFDLYRAFHQDAEDNQQWVKKNGKCKVPSISLMGGESFLATIAEEQNQEMYETTAAATVSGSGHWCAEENPKDFVKQVLTWVGKHIA
ncbi:Alpha/Beta hydrolase protein [Delphinella strobiligena]|nr:Alpha/Beta hydrolase protein [Delphinella strobiligena]